MTVAFLQVRAPRASRRSSGQHLWRPASSLIQSFTCTCFLFSPSPSSVNNHKIHCSRKANYYTKGWFWRFVFGCISLKLIIPQKLEEDIYIYICVHIYIYTNSCSLCCTAETQHCKTTVFQLKKKKNSKVPQLTFLVPPPCESSAQGVWITPPMVYATSPLQTKQILSTLGGGLKKDVVLPRQDSQFWNEH